MWGDFCVLYLLLVLVAGFFVGALFTGCPCCRPLFVRDSPVAYFSTDHFAISFCRLTLPYSLFLESRLAVGDCRLVLPYSPFFCGRFLHFYFLRPPLLINIFYGYSLLGVSSWILSYRSFPISSLAASSADIPCGCFCQTPAVGGCQLALFLQSDWLFAYSSFPLQAAFRRLPYFK